MRNRLYTLVYQIGIRIGRPWFVGKLIRYIIHGRTRNQVFQCLFQNTIPILMPNDVYWARYISNPAAYEPEVGALLNEVLKTDTAFIDGGANIGFWSSVACYLTKCPEQVIAVEASSQVMNILRLNQVKHGFKMIPKAIHSHIIPSISFYEYEQMHTHDSLIMDSAFRDDIQVTKVSSTTLDVIVEKHIRRSDLVIKLDIEGSEKLAFRGTTNLVKQKRNMLIIYEDHGKNINSDVTRYVLEELKLNVYYIKFEQGLICQPIESWSYLMDIKTDKRKGYNFVSTIPGTPFDSKLKSLVGS